VRASEITTWIELLLHSVLHRLTMKRFPPRMFSKITSLSRITCGCPSAPNAALASCAHAGAWPQGPQTRSRVQRADQSRAARTRALTEPLPRRDILHECELNIGNSWVCLRYTHHMTPREGTSWECMPSGRFSTTVKTHDRTRKACTKFREVSFCKSARSHCGHVTVCGTKAEGWMLNVEAQLTC
jgi:hypothetical protein